VDLGQQHDRRAIGGQTADVRDLQRSILADVMGLGKTLQMLTLCVHRPPPNLADDVEMDDQTDRDQEEQAVDRQQQVPRNVLPNKQKKKKDKVVNLSDTNVNKKERD